MLGTATVFVLAVLYQQAPTSTVPMRDEPYHRLVVENPLVAVYDVRLPVGAVMRYHEHPTNHLAIVIDSGVMQNEVVGRPAKVNPSGAQGTVVYIEAGPPHRQTNIGRTAVRFIAVEVLKPPGATNDTTAAAGTGRGVQHRAGPDGVTGCRAIIDQSDVQVWRCRLPPGQTAQRRRHSRPFLRVMVSSGRLESLDPSGRGGARELEAGATDWHKKPSAVGAKNVGNSPIEFVDLEWK